MEAAVEDFKKNFAEQLRRLEVEEEDEVTAKMLSKKFKNQALKHILTRQVISAMTQSSKDSLMTIPY